MTQHSISSNSLKSRKFLFLQGPHGPFFGELARELCSHGAEVVRIAFNAGDRFYWPKNFARVDYQGEAEDWSLFVDNFITQNQITDLVLYAESRPIHQEAIQAARAHNVMTHFFEEGYLRPYWVTYEREGVNGNSPIMNMDIVQIREQRAQNPVNEDPAPAAWGNLWHHNWYGFTYHFQLWLGRQSFPNYKPHRNISLLREWRLNAGRLLSWPYRIVERNWETARFLKRKPKFDVVLLQLDHDASLKVHSDYESQKQFIDEVVTAFANAAHPDLELVFKLHPLEDFRVPIVKWVKQSAKANHVSDRVKVFYGGELGKLLDGASGAVTVNSTAAQQVLWRNLPLKVMGRSIFDKPEFVFPDPLDDFFQNGRSLDHQAFLEFRSFLLETSQIPGGFYSQNSRDTLLEHAVAIMAAKTHPYDRGTNGV